MTVLAQPGAANSRRDGSSGHQITEPRRQSSEGDTVARRRTSQGWTGGLRPLGRGAGDP
jgi:hypothetical protein